MLQERIFSPGGSRDQLRFSGRLIVATNQDLDRLRAEGSLREDFYYRLSSQVIQVPPLRQRLEEDPEELTGLTRALLNRIVGELDNSLLERVIGALSARHLADHPWAGNVRELEQAIRRILLTGHYAPALPKPTASRNPIADEPTLRRLNARYCAQLYRRYGSYEEVSRRADLDRRTARKYVLEGMDETIEASPKVGSSSDKRRSPW